MRKRREEQKTGRKGREDGIGKEGKRRWERRMIEERRKGRWKIRKGREE